MTSQLSVEYSWHLQTDTIHTNLTTATFKKQDLNVFFGSKNSLGFQQKINSIFFCSKIPNRCATGESWQAIMLSCRSGRPCDPKARQNDSQKDSCGSDLAYSYFVTFIFFCSFLVSFFCLFFGKVSLDLNGFFSLPFKRC